MLRVVSGRLISITAAVTDELNIWRHPVASLSERLTHLRDIRPNKPAWIGATDRSLEGMGGVCRSPAREW